MKILFTIIGFSVILSIIVAGKIPHIVSEKSGLPASTICPAPEPCTLQRCAGFVSGVEFLGNYFLCEGDEDLESCYNSEKTSCLDRCVLFLINPAKQSSLSTGTDETEKLTACENVCSNQLAIYKTTKAFRMKQCEWEVPDPYHRRKIAIMEENTKRSGELENIEYGKVVIYKGRKCYRSFIDSLPYDCVVCVGDRWRNI